jgi:hypothetical protein
LLIAPATVLAWLIRDGAGIDADGTINRFRRIARRAMLAPTTEELPRL